MKVFLPNQARILSYILCYIPNREDADDVFQNTTSVLWKKFDNYAPGTDFVAWSVAIARFEIMSYYKRKKREGKIHFDEHLRGILDADLPAVDSHFNERIEALRDCLKKLMTTDIQIIKMRYEQDLSFARIADRLGISSTAVFKNVTKIHSRLIECIRRQVSYRVGHE